MKKILTLGVLALVASSGQYMAQSQTTALDLASQTDSRGSARYQALSGAVGAIGVDFSSVHQNPAGIAFFRSGSKVSVTLSHTTYKGENLWGTEKYTDKSKGKLHFDELSYISSISLASGKNLTWGVGIQNNGRLYRRMNSYNPQGETSSIGNYISSILQNNGGLNFSEQVGSNAFYNNRAWLGTLGVQLGWIKPDNGGIVSAYDGLTVGEASLVTSESGGVSNVDFALGAEVSSKLSLGASLSLISMQHEYISLYEEVFNEKNAEGDKYLLRLGNTLTTSGYAARLGLGVIYRPIDNLRLGLSFYTPTFGTYEIHTRAIGESTSPEMGISPYITPTLKNPIASETPSAVIDSFRYTSPWRVGISGAYTFGRKAILSADYEYQSYNQARLSDVSSYGEGEVDYTPENDAISSDFGGLHTIRVGLEFNATKRLALRAGLRHTTSPNYVADLKANRPTIELLVPGTSVHYRLPGSIQSYSLGLGYRLSPKWTLDLAYVLRTQKDRVASYPYIREDASNTPYQPQELIKDTQRQNTLSATLSYRF